ncbi:hypothetical protein JCM8097_000454 [Rhodosporidiobolus ruineniae]
MAYAEPRRFVGGKLQSADSYDSLRPPYPSAPYAQSASGGSSPASSSDGVDGAFAALQGQRRGRPHQQQQTWTPPPPPVHQGQGKHEVVHVGGTGVLEAREDPRLKWKRVSLMVICGLVVVAIIAVAVLGCKKLL